METFVNDTPRLTFKTGLDASTYTKLAILYKKPSGTTGHWIASVHPSNNEWVTYVCVHGDLDTEGKWLVQPVDLATGKKLTGRWGKFTVHDPLTIITLTTAAPTTAPPTTLPPTT